MAHEKPQQRLSSGLVYVCMCAPSCVDIHMHSTDGDQYHHPDLMEDWPHYFRSGWHLVDLGGALHIVLKARSTVCCRPAQPTRSPPTLRLSQFSNREDRRF